MFIPFPTSLRFLAILVSQYQCTSLRWYCVIADMKDLSFSPPQKVTMCTSEGFLPFQVGKDILVIKINVRISCDVMRCSF